MIAQSTITCPSCGHETAETMPTDACQFFYECTGCGALLRPNKGDCCVFCSFGSVPCPPIQAERGGQLGAGESCCFKREGETPQRLAQQWALRFVSNTRGWAPEIDRSQ